MIKYSKLTDFKIKKIIKHFVVDLTATQAAEILGFNRKTINHYYSIFRKIIYANQIEKFKGVIGGEIENDEDFAFYLLKTQNKDVADEFIEVLGINKVELLVSRIKARAKKFVNIGKIKIEVNFTPEELAFFNKLKKWEHDSTESNFIVSGIKA